MAKKRDRAKKSVMPRNWKASITQVNRWQDELDDAIYSHDFKLAKQLAQKILRHVPVVSAAGKYALEQLSVALGMLQEFEAAYQAASKAVSLQPERSDLWYNFSLAACFTMRSVESLSYVEKAAALEKNETLLATYAKHLDLMREAVAQELALRGPDFTAEQLLEQQTLFLQGMAQLQERHSTEAETTFKQVIAMGDVLPQPWANLAGCYLWQERYDEAEAAYKRALEVDPDYTLARQNLQLLPLFRERGLASMTTVVTHPFEGKLLNRELIFIE